MSNLSRWPCIYVTLKIGICSTGSDFFLLFYNYQATIKYQKLVRDLLSLYCTVLGWEWVCVVGGGGATKPPGCFVSYWIARQSVRFGWMQYRLYSHGSHNTGSSSLAPLKLNSEPSRPIWFWRGNWIILSNPPPLSGDRRAERFRPALIDKGSVCLSGVWINDGSPTEAGKSEFDSVTPSCWHTSMLFP